MALDEKLIDKRVVRRNLERGRVDATAYRGMLESLPDASANVQRHDSATQSGSSASSSNTSPT